MLLPVLTPWSLKTVSKPLLTLLLTLLKEIPVRSKAQMISQESQQFQPLILRLASLLQFLLKISASYPRARGGDPIWSNASL